LLPVNTASAKKAAGDLSGGMEKPNSRTVFVAELVPSNRRLVEFSIVLAANTREGMAEVTGYEISEIAKAGL